MFDPSAGEEQLYRRDVKDVFASGQLSFNYLKVDERNKLNMWVSPSIKFSNKRDFKEDSLLKIQKNSDFTVDGKTYKMIDKEVSFYRSSADRLKSLVIEVPFVFYFPKVKYGLEVSPSVQASPKWDKLGVRLGIYIPVGTNDEIITIEPLINLSNLNRRHLTFFKDQFSFGFNVSVAIPKFMSGN